MPDVLARARERGDHALGKCTRAMADLYDPDLARAAVALILEGQEPPFEARIGARMVEALWFDSTEELADAGVDYFGPVARKRRRPLAGFSKSDVADTTNVVWRRPTVKLRPVSGSAGSTVAFPFTVADNSGRVDIVLVIYNGPRQGEGSLPQGLRQSDRAGGRPMPDIPSRARGNSRRVTSERLRTPSHSASRPWARPGLRVSHIGSRGTPLAGTMAS